MAIADELGTRAGYDDAVKHAPHPEGLIGGNYNLATLGDKIADVSLGEYATPRGWWLFLLVGLGLMQGMVVGLAYLFYMGTGVWGINQPVGWGFAIINFVWWIGIGHAGTLISAILLLMHQKWRTSLNRFAEAMTIFAVMCAGIFPLVHMGRAVAGVLAVPRAHELRHVAAVPQPPVLGRGSRFRRMRPCRLCSGTSG